MLSRFFRRKKKQKKDSVKDSIIGEGENISEVTIIGDLNPNHLEVRFNDLPKTFKVENKTYTLTLNSLFVVSKKFWKDNRKGIKRRFQTVFLEETKEAITLKDAEEISGELLFIAEHSDTVRQALESLFKEVKAPFSLQGKKYLIIAVIAVVGIVLALYFTHVIQFPVAK